MRIEEVRGRIPLTTSRKLKYGGVAIKTRNKSLTLTKIDFFSFNNAQNGTSRTLNSPHIFLSIHFKTFVFTRSKHNLEQTTHF